MRYNNYRSNSDDVTLGALGAVVAIPLISLFVYGMNNDASFGWKLFNIIKSNPEFIMMILFSIGVIVFSKIKFHEEYSWIEGTIHFGAIVLSIIVMYLVFFTSGTDIKDDSIFNGKVATAVYMEPWTEEVEHTSCDSDGRNCTTYTTYDRHSPEWYLTTTNQEDGKVSISVQNFNNIAKFFGNNVEHTLHHMNQTMASRAAGEGDMWVSSAYSKSIPTSISHDVVNYIKANHATVLKKRFTETPAWATKYLATYPSVYNNPYGPIEFNRVIDKSGYLSANDIKIIDKQIDGGLETLGRARKANVIVYFVPETVDQTFIGYLENYWTAFNKNDIIVLCAIDKEKVVQWSLVKAMTKHTLFNIELQDKIRGNDVMSIPSSVISQLKIPDLKENGFLLTSMEEYSYLMGSVDIPLTYSLIGIVVTCLLNLLFSFIMIKVSEI